ncbi:hypothetical protein niasHS_012304 [Heterodera schachtii]|uniref:NADAR domain-containing protein n=1 Tax=Heterodera schachtii TaxID=97005 RepID=A0ABD2IN92_HETSC
MEVAVPFLLNNVPAFKFFTRRYVLSNHFVHTFTMDFDGYGHIHVMSSEHCYFLMKAAHFGDMASFHRIRQAQTPASAKQLGRRIMPFVEEVWHAVRFGIMCRELRAKFNVEPMRSALLTTGYGQLVEASLDEFWAARREVLALIREEVSPLPPTPNHLVRHYVVAQASAEDYPGLAVGDILVVVGYYWHAAFERVALNGHPTLPGWLHQGQIVSQAEADMCKALPLCLGSSCMEWLRTSTLADIGPSPSLLRQCPCLRTRPHHDTAQHDHQHSTSARRAKRATAWEGGSGCFEKIQKNHHMPSGADPNPLTNGEEEKSQIVSQAEADMVQALPLCLGSSCMEWLRTSTLADMWTIAKSAPSMSLSTDASTLLCISLNIQMLVVSSSHRSAHHQFHHFPSISTFAHPVTHRPAERQASREALLQHLRRKKPLSALF